MVYLLFIFDSYILLPSTVRFAFLNYKYVRTCACICFTAQALPTMKTY